MDIKDIENLAQLARIELSDTEKKSLLKDLDSILGYVKQIESLDLANEGQTSLESRVMPYNVWREDEIKPCEFSRDLIMKQFPDSQDGFLKVKKIL